MSVRRKRNQQYEWASKWMCLCANFISIAYIFCLFCLAHFHNIFCFCCGCCCSLCLFCFVIGCCWFGLAFYACGIVWCMSVCVRLCSAFVDCANILNAQLWFLSRSRIQLFMVWSINKHILNCLWENARVIRNCVDVFPLPSLIHVFFYSFFFCWWWLIGFLWKTTRNKTTT